MNLLTHFQYQHSLRCLYICCAMCDSGIASGLVLYSPDAPATTSPIVTWGMPGYQRVKLWVDDRWIVDQVNHTRNHCFTSPLHHKTVFLCMISLCDSPHALYWILVLTQRTVLQVDQHRYDITVCNGKLPTDVPCDVRY